VSEDLRNVASVDRVIHEPARLMLVALLYNVEEADFLWLLHESNLTKGNLSSHFAKLEEAGYVAVEKTYRGKVPQTIFSLTKAGRKAFEAYRKSLSAVMG
jgi:DNA-binding MarR family transcriptional regulator